MSDRPGLPDPSTLRALRAQARRLSRCDADAEDLLQDVLLVALQARRADPAWLSGVLRRQAALAVRTAVRRRRRERAAAGPLEFGPCPGDGSEPEACATQLLAKLPPASRRVAELALHGLGAPEIRWLLGVPEAAFRQRVAMVRRTVAALPPELRGAIRSLAEPPVGGGRPRSGPLRRALKAAMRGIAAVGTHDPDGHLLLVDRPAHVPAPGGNG
ncbi:sigma-70 family RNA polymerase sigma factor [Luteimonas sp. RD2P54]|uniref:Sigma-70 family RNA polymerase sigma factor n=1 Tax=Luteimonas endophytica TaxID=3042023 RepID=A0ABT6J6J4_9GAMM|nr:sigma-70 family RNA polymerase sigma factor [Luteimonas endophytica]MDH5822187.1 sigma-70 family RNA polymerase sigma factor [Luteimonas endophytica]